MNKTVKNAIKLIAITGAAGLIFGAYCNYCEEKELEKFVLAHLDYN